MAGSGDTIALTILIAIVAALYASVGQAGASGYLALLGLAGFAPEVMKPTALALNVLVATIGTVSLMRSGFFSWRNFYPFAVLGAPFSLLGGSVQLPAQYYYPLVGIILLIASAQLVRAARLRRTDDAERTAPPPFFPALLSGAAIGFVSGTTGSGGGIFLAPLILLTGWVETRRATAVTAAYNLLNSIAALFGAWTSTGILPAALPLWLVAAGIGGLLGTWIGTRYLSPVMLRYVLAGIIALAAIKLLSTGWL